MTSNLSEKLLNDSSFQSILVSCLEELERGDSLDREQLLRQHSEFAGPLEEFLDDQAMLRKVASGVRESIRAASAGLLAVAQIEETLDSRSEMPPPSAGDLIRYVGEYEIREQSLPPRRAAELVKTVAEAVDFAHQQDTLHRDLKPANVLIDHHGQPHVTDFGLAKIIAAEESSNELTASGQVLGTPNYMSPEQAAGKHSRIGPATDVYALGAVLYACMTGRAPSVADSALDAMAQVLQNEPASPRTLNTKVPKDLETICLKCLEKEPQKRYGSAIELAGSLEEQTRLSDELTDSLHRQESLTRQAERRLYYSQIYRAVVEMQAGRYPTASTVLQSTSSQQRGWEAGHLLRQASGTALTLPGHPWGVGSVAFSPDGQHLVSGGADETVEVWDVAEGELILELSGHESDVSSVAFSPDARRIVTGGKTIKVWDRNSDAATLTFHPHDDLTTNVAFSPDGGSLVSGSRGGIVKLWQPTTGESIHTLRGHEDEVTSVSFCPDGECIVSESRDRMVMVWKTKSGENILTLRQHEGSAGSVTFSPVGRQIASCGESVKISDAATADMEFLFHEESKIDLWAEDAARRRVTDPVYHAEAAEQAEVDQDGFAALFHLRWLVQHHVNDAAFENRFERAKAAWFKESRSEAHGESRQ